MIQNHILILRAPEPTDIEALYEWENDTELWSVSNTLVPFSRHQLSQYIKHARLDMYQTKQVRMMIEHLQSGKLCGMIDLYDFDPFHSRGGIGILIHQQWRGKGIAIEALTLFVQYLFSHIGIHQVYATIASDNTNSINLFSKAGFEHTGTRKQWHRKGREYYDELFFQKINDSFISTT